ncbi:MAG: hypothetical protein GDA48_01455 [Hormoscilla sp. GM102CHS1]|nr:hypothetical protein [Hormoscilla sp. GM102CHS1]
MTSTFFLNREVLRSHLIFFTKFRRRCPIANFPYPDRIAPQIACLRSLLLFHCC